jgi:hypothetical protein
MDTWKDILYNIVYKTGSIFDQIRIMYAMIDKGTYLDKEVYVISRSIGGIINVILSPDVPRKYT